MEHKAGQDVPCIWSRSIIESQDKSFGLVTFIWKVFFQWHSFFISSSLTLWTFKNKQCWSKYLNIHIKHWPYKDLSNLSFFLTGQIISLLLHLSLQDREIKPLTLFLALRSAPELWEDFDPCAVRGAGWESGCHVSQLDSTWPCC